jgi:oxygen-independent coproporphyrinogen-3 oxidase
MAGIYLHIPFCFKRCDYCDFFKTTNISLKSDFLNILKKEIDKNRNFIDSEIIETVYFGGGTPSVLMAEEVKLILDFIFTEEKKLDRAGEITFELNPDDGSSEYLNELRKTGVHRLSIGIQSFDDRLLKLLNRGHNANQAKSVVNNARAAGFENISIDLMYGLPTMDMESWERSIDEAINMQVEHISAYHLTYEKGTVFNKKLERGVFKEIPRY